MISKTLEDIEKDIKYLKEIANEEYFKKVEEMCNEVNKRNNELQERIDKAIDFIDGKDIDYYSDNYNELLNILKGGNNE